MNHGPCHSTDIDVAVFGGGVAGLWILGRLRARGFRAVLLEAHCIGSGQTRYAQGIVHGGTKYALTGEFGESARAVAAMPEIWRACLAGEGELDLSATQLMSDHQLLWSTRSLTSRMAGFFASRVMRSRTAAVPPEEYPVAFRHPDFKGSLYRLDEPVLDTASLIDALAAPHQDVLVKMDWPAGVHFDRDAGRWAVRLEHGGRQLAIAADRLVFAAGRGNGDLLAALGRAQPEMQLRPLQMVMLRGDTLPTGIYAHCLGASTNPRLTISSHFDAQGRPVWYLGGQLAEDGVGRTRDEQIASARAELAALLPWLDLSQVEWSTLEIERAEPRQADGSRPEGVFCEERDGIITTWPTKMALAPRLADEVMARLEDDGVRPRAGDAGPGLPNDWPRPERAPLPWQEEMRWS